ncbi:MAG: hypothetical protein K9J12_00485 [Melioribacteraceae bacterium]|nr:hypothetical protein [Melioribacteraceae bacterium]MCF8413670.1 hypothetical protein [Melioribacteraceae bacterium]
MKKLLLIFVFLPLLFTSGQKIGKLAAEKPPEQFPPNSWGADIMFGEGGFGLGTFYRKSFSLDLKGFIDFSISESKDDREFEYIDYFGNSYTVGKKNRVFILPLNFGLQYRLFTNEITDNLRPYINFGVGPTFVVSTPYEKEFFASFGQADFRVAAGGYIGFGANFGLSKESLLGLNVRYYFARLFDEGVESLYGKTRKDLGGFYVTLNIGMMY